jgi:hypothetical protein
MRSGRQQRELLKEIQRPPPAERTFAQLFPWRNVARAMLLVVIILAIVAIQRSTGSLFSRVGELLGPPTPTPTPTPTSSPEAPRPAAPQPPGQQGPRVRLGPGLAPRLVPSAWSARARLERMGGGAGGAGRGTEPDRR